MLSDPFHVRKAAKPWTCTHCGVAIAKGDLHLEYVGETAAYQSGSRYCAICAENVWAIDAAHFHAREVDRALPTRNGD